jgi:multidrug efflux system outer membrane protein
MASAALRGSLPGVALEIGAKQTGGYTTGVFAVAIGLPVFDQGAGARQRAHGEQQIAEAELRAAEQRVTTEVTAALGAYQRLLAARPESAVALAAQGAEIAQIAEAAYREGAIPLIELLDAERAHADARAEAARWSAELATARIALNRALGAPIEEGL